MLESTCGNPSVVRGTFGIMPNGEEIEIFSLSNSNLMRISVINYGATLTECHVKDKNGKAENVVLGFDNLDQYLAKHPRFGASIGRYANRIANAEFELDGKVYKLNPTHGKNTLHGGKIGFDKKVWKAVSGSDANSAWVRFDYFSPDMEEGFPGNLSVSVCYCLNNANVMSICYEAETDRATPLNLTNHSYFNLAGAGHGDVLAHVAQFNADKYTETDDSQIPTGKLLSVENSAFDFSKPRKIAERISETGGGYDHNLIIADFDSSMKELGSVMDPESGRSLKVRTDQPAFQFFTANGLDGSIKGLGGPYCKHAGFCLETQHFPDSVHHPEFPNVVLRPAEKFSSKTEFQFLTESKS